MSVVKLYLNYIHVFPPVELFQRRRLMRVAFSMSNVKRSIFKRNAVMEDAFAALKWIRLSTKTEPLNAKVRIIDYVFHVPF